MRTIYLTNDKKRDAQVGFEGRIPKTPVEYVLKDGGTRESVSVLKKTNETSLAAMIKQCGSLDNVAESLISGDPEIDLEQTGKFIGTTRKVYVDSKGQIAYRAKLITVVKDSAGKEKSRSPFVQAKSNIAMDVPINWTGKKIPKSVAVKKFVFSRKYQIKHVNGITYDFLYDIAAQLAKSDSMMMVGAGTSGTEPLVFSNGGVPYRGFLEGRIQEESYCLILHLTNLELKEIV